MVMNNITGIDVAAPCFWVTFLETETKIVTIAFVTKREIFEMKIKHMQLVIVLKNRFNVDSSTCMFAARPSDDVYSFVHTRVLGCVGSSINIR